jgi:hypothetical protein
MSDFWVMLAICLPLGAIMCLLMLWGTSREYNREAEDVRKRIEEAEPHV